MKVYIFLSSLLFVLLFCIFHIPVCDGAVLGVDFGSEFIKVASVAPGSPFHIVIDEQSKRKIPSVISFEGGERHFGNGATQFTVKKPKETYWFIHRLLGESILSDRVKEFSDNYYPYEIVEIENRQSLGLKHTGFDGNETIYTVEEIIAMSFLHLVKAAEIDNNNIPIKDLVLTVPEYYSQQARQAIIDAAELCGLNVLSLINENSAAAIQYGIDRKYENQTEAHNVLFYNMGSTSTKVTLAQFSGYLGKSGKYKNKTIGQVEILGVATDSYLGGQYFELALTNHFADDINKQLKAKGHNDDIRNNVKAMGKIRIAAEKAKNVLSANQDTPSYLPGLIHDTDFKIHITREEFYKLSQHLFDRVNKPIETLLNELNFKSEDIHNVLIIGGSVRIPAVQTLIKQYLNKEALGQSLNGDEAMAMGSVFRAANLSTAFQVRAFGFTDITQFPVGVKLSDYGVNEDPSVTTPSDSSANSESDNEDETVEDSSNNSAVFTKRASLFKRNNKLSKRKTVAFTHTRDFTASLFHDAPADKLPAGLSIPIITYNVTGLTDAYNHPRYSELLKTQKPRVAVTFLLDASGIVTLTKAEATLEEMVKSYLPKPKVVNNTANTNSTANNSTANANNSTSTENTSSEGNEENSNSESAESNQAETDTDAAGSTESAETTAPAGTDKDKEKEKDPSILTDEKGEYRMKKQSVHIPLRINRIFVPSSSNSKSPQPMSFADKREAKARLEKLKRADELKKEIAQAKNTLEAHVYNTRNTINEGILDSVTTEDQRSAVLDELSAIEDWIYEQSDESPVIFKEKLFEIQSKTDPMQLRLTEMNERPQAVNSSRSLFIYIRTQMADYAVNRTWIKEEEREKLLNMVHEAESWLNETIIEQDKLQPFENPVLLSSKLYDRLRPIAKISQEYSKIKKPIEKPKPKPSSKKSNTTKTNETATEGGDNSSTDTDPSTTPGSDDAQAKSGTDTETAEKASESTNEQEIKVEATADEVKKDEL